jgi:hypothetical protein
LARRKPRACRRLCLPMARERRANDLGSFRAPLASIAQATAIAVALCFWAADPGSVAGHAAPFLVVTPAAAAATERDFTEDDVKAAVKKVVDERTTDGVFVFRDRKLNADLSLIFEQVKIVRGAEGYGWFATPSSTIRTRPRSNTPSTSGSNREAIS